ncbi:MAG: hypothetical protein JSU66_10970 [Deltaproteobacteria bacterium]|nr:MAG: hypothetical protein JSU66_10970 [Deltaproteobacteria bacterium]
MTEALVAASEQCPNAAVRAVAARALETIRREGASALPAQAFLVLSAAAGWRGDRAEAVKDALRRFVEADAQS